MLALSLWALSGAAQNDSEIDVAGQKKILFERLKKTQGENKKKENAHVLIEIANLYRTVAVLDSAIYYYENVLTIHQDEPVLNEEEHATTHYQLGNLFRQTSQYVQAVDHYEQGISIAVENNFLQREASLLNSMGGLYVEIEEFEKGLDYCKRGLAIYQENFPERKLDICLFLTNIGNISVEMGDYNQANRYLKQALELNQELKNDYYFALIYSGLGMSDLKQKNYENSLENLDVALKYAILSANQPIEVAVLANIGQVYIEKREYDKAEEVLLEAHLKANQIGDKYLRKQLLSSLIELYSESGQYDLAFSYQKKYTDLRDSILTKDLLIDLANAELKYENSQKEKRILELQVQNERQSFDLKRNRYLMVIVFSFLVLIFVTLVLITQRNRSRNEAKIHEFENKMFRLQIKPHFIFNVLSSIQGYMNTHDSKKAGVYLSKFARLIRNVLEQSRKDFIPISKEIQNLKYYLELQQLRFEDCFDFEFHIDPEIDPEIILIPPMLVQPIVENSVEHGFSREENNGHLNLFFERKEDTLVVKIEDNGRGFDVTKKNHLAEKKSKESLSVQMIKEQLAYFNKQLSGEFSIQYDHIWPEKDRKGTRVTIIIPYIQQQAS